MDAETERNNTPADAADVSPSIEFGSFSGNGSDEWGTRDVQEDVTMFIPGGYYRPEESSQLRGAEPEWDGKLVVEPGNDKAAKVAAAMADW